MDGWMDGWMDEWMDGWMAGARDVSLFQSVHTGSRPTHSPHQGVPSSVRSGMKRPLCDADH